MAKFPANVCFGPGMRRQPDCPQVRRWSLVQRCRRDVRSYFEARDELVCQQLRLGEHHVVAGLKLPQAPLGKFTQTLDIAAALRKHTDDVTLRMDRRAFSRANRSGCSKHLHGCGVRRGSIQLTTAGSATPQYGRRSTSGNTQSSTPLKTSALLRRATTMEGLCLTKTDRCWASGNPGREDDPHA